MRSMPLAGMGRARKTCLGSTYSRRPSDPSIRPSSFARKLRSIETAGCKLIESSNGSTEIFEVEVDRKELDDLSASEPERVEAMRHLLRPRTGCEDHGKRDREQVVDPTLERRSGHWVISLELLRGAGAWRRPKSVGSVASPLKPKAPRGIPQAMPKLSGADANLQTPRFWNSRYSGTRKTSNALPGRVCELAPDVT
jgi:hypothetical protein